MFYCLRFETPPTWRARCPYLYHRGKGWRSWRHRFQQFLYCCVLIRCRGKVITLPLPGNEKLLNRHVTILLRVLHLCFRTVSDELLPTPSFSSVTDKSVSLLGMITVVLHDVRVAFLYFQTLSKQSSRYTRVTQITSSLHITSLYTLKGFSLKGR
jgi:hypothetical protein